MTALDYAAFSRIPGDHSKLEVLRLGKDPFGFFEQRVARHGRVFRSWMLGPVVFLIGPEANRHIMVTGRDSYSYGLGYGQTSFSTVFEGSILSLDGEAHRVVREALAPAVGKLGLGESQAKVQAAWSLSADSVRQGASVDAYAFAQRTTFDVSAHALIGLPLDAELERYRPLFESLIEGTMAPLKLRIPFGRLDRALSARKKLIELLGPKVANARERAPNGMLGLLANHRDESGKAMTVEQIVSHVLLLFWAGYDTTATSGSWVLHQLAHHPDWQERLRDEIREELGDDDYTPDLGKKLTQLEWFLKEIERACPSVMMFPRVLLEDVELHGHLVPRGFRIYYSPWMSHRLPELFDEPNRFDPARWDPTREGHANAAHLVGFGGGPRLCLGRGFALMQLRVMITTLLRRYRIEPDLSRPFRIQGVPMHHPVGSYVRFRAVAQDSCVASSNRIEAR